MDYVAKHAQLLSELRDQKLGARADFSKSIPGEYDPLTDTVGAPTTNTVKTFAVSITPGTDQEYREMSLISNAAEMLMVVPVKINVIPGEDYVVHWAGAERTVRKIFPIRPAGVSIAARVIVD